jgi:hypothetical protein
MSNRQQRRQRNQKRPNAAQREQERLDREHRQRRRVMVGGTVLVLVVAGIVVLTLNLTAATPSGSTSIATQPFTAGTQVALGTSAPPWPVPSDSRPYIAAAGLQVLGQEALAVHYHAHLDVIVNGSAVQVPAGIGMVMTNRRETGITVVHTHDSSGVIHIESPTDSPYMLGQFVTEWGVRLATGQLGGLTNSGGKTLRVYVDGHLFNGNSASIVLRPHQEITLWYGSARATPKVPSAFQFPAGE